MKNNPLQPSNKQNQTINPLTNNKQALKKQKYRLIMSIQELKQPVLNVVHEIIAKKQNKENTMQYKSNKKHSKSYAEFANKTMKNYTNDLSGNAAESQEYKKMKEKCNFTQKVHRFFTSKKYNYIGEQDNIDRLNAKLDKYISRYLGHKHQRQGKLII